jgi:hypothetical protein
MRVELADFATEQDEASVAEDNAEQVDDEVDETEEAGDDEQDAVDVEDVAETDDTSSEDADKQAARGATLRTRTRRIKWSRVIAFGVLPVLAVVAAAAAGIFYWQNTQNRGSSAAGIESVEGVLHPVNSRRGDTGRQKGAHLRDCHGSRRGLSVGDPNTRRRPGICQPDGDGWQ